MKQLRLLKKKQKTNNLLLLASSRPPPGGFFVGKFFMKQDLIIIGKCGRPYGVRGWMHIQSFTEEPANITQYKSWILLHRSGKQEPATVEGIRAHGNHFVAKIKGIDSPEAIKAYGLAQIAVARENLPELGEKQHYWADLAGLEAKLPNGISLGKIDSLFETGANDVIVVITPEGKRLLIPYIDSVVLGIDLDTRTMTVDWDPAERAGKSHD